MTTYDALLCPTLEWIEAAHQTEPDFENCTKLSRGMAGGEPPCDSYILEGLAIVGACSVCPLVPPSFTVTEEPSKGDKVGIVVPCDYPDHKPVCDAPGNSCVPAVVGRSEITAVEPSTDQLVVLDEWGRQLPDDLIPADWDYRVLLAPVVWLNEPETTIDCPTCARATPGFGGVWCSDYGTHPNGDGRVPIPVLASGEFRKLNP